MGWKENAAMFWHDGTTWQKISDHNRAPIDIGVERLERKARMVDGSLRRHTVTKKRTFSVSWTNFPSKRDPSYGGKAGMGTVDGGWAGEDIENFHNNTDTEFRMKLRKGTDEAKAANDGTIEEVTVMITDFSKSVDKRGIVDLWTLNITLEEV